MHPKFIIALQAFRNSQVTISAASVSRHNFMTNIDENFLFSPSIHGTIELYQKNVVV
jgi:hypothetical protein